MLPPSTSLGKPVFAKIAASEVLYSPSRVAHRGAHRWACKSAH